MNIVKTIARLDFSNLWLLLKLSIAHLGYLWPTFEATKECMQVSSEHFGRKHYQNGQANAFRHALWNVLIAKSCARKKEKLKNALDWTKKITDWHEKAFFSKSLPMTMDYHNNAVGRWLFETNSRYSKEEFITNLLVLTAKATQITKESNLELYKNQLVYITNDH
ncbi:DUF6973 domain-containing protein [Croceivirga thetidis]|uniref:DUF6973 domain-containing protein n=1 Tax=Croceivirga thetidis TaxID=2721623 RepID=A0ABX1GMD6_9FLAO|nr:hypothetical protein [Croceivirga thetidis]NKI31082.1 hypothetical protein [Croceivirga thetidis]